MPSSRESKTPEKSGTKGNSNSKRRSKKKSHSEFQLAAYRKEVEDQRRLVLSAQAADGALTSVIEAMSELFADSDFVSLLNSEGLNRLPKNLSDRLRKAGR